MKSVILLASALLVSMTLIGQQASANETSQFGVQPIVMWTQKTIDAIETEIAKTTPLAEKATAVKALMEAEANAKDGFCDTAVAVFTKIPQPAEATKVRQACEQFITAPATVHGVASGEYSKAADQSRPLRQVLSELSSVYILFIATF